jgi:hypothetical protein
MPVIAVLNESARVSNADARRMTRACNKQIERDVAPAWQQEPSRVRFYRREADVPEGAAVIVILDSATSADLLGYHSETPGGHRYGRVFVDPVLEDGGSVYRSRYSVSTVLSHEVIEVFIDPDINLWAEGEPGVMWAYEACDPVEADAYRIRVDSRYVYISNFVFPTWFDRENPPGTRFDQMDLVSEPFTIRPDGYAVYWEGGSSEKIFWGRRYPRKVRSASKRHIAARTRRRTSGRVQF